MHLFELCLVCVPAIPHIYLTECSLLKVLYTMPNGGNLGTYVDKHEGMPLVMIEVEAWVNCPERRTAQISNHFYFTFALPYQKTCRKVLPANIDQARRQASRMCADESQAELRP